VEYEKVIDIRQENSGSNNFKHSDFKYSVRDAAEIIPYCAAYYWMHLRNILLDSD
jgi:hypothetical protein